MIDARHVTQSLAGRWHGRYGAAPCPVCQSERRKGQNALTLADGRNGRLLLDCKKSSCAFLDILAATGLRSANYTPPDPAILAQRERAERAEAEKRSAQAARLWQESQPIAGTPAEAYLRERGITCPVPPTLRFHRDCWHGPTARRYPAMVAAVQGAGLPAVHRTYLRADGLGKAGLDGGDKLMLGPCAGGVVALSETQGPLVVCEGIETGLSLASGLLDAPATIWAALSTSGLRALILPPQPGALIIAFDGDEPGRAAALALAERAYFCGWQVSMMPAPDGHDWNDVLTGKVSA